MAQQTGGSSACLNNLVPLAPDLSKIGELSLLLCFMHSPLLTETITFYIFGSKMFIFL